MVILENCRVAYGKKIVELGHKNKDIIVLDGDLSTSTKTIYFWKEFPDRFFDIGIAEQNLIGISAGLAASGKIVFASSYSIFILGRGFEQIRNTVAHDNLNVKIVASHAGVTVGQDGSSHQAIEDIALIRSLPNFHIYVPADSVETEFIIEEIIKNKSPTYVRICRIDLPVLFDKDFKFKLNKGIIIREGADISIISMGLMVHKALEAAEKLEKIGINAEVINMSSIKPIDSKLIIKSAKKTGAVITAEEHNIIGGLGSAVAEVLVENQPTIMKRIGIQDEFGQSGDPYELLKHYGLTTEKILDESKKLINLKR
ncbi:MAG: transketolase family protein [Candidatus Lokiarchaeota archaeon]|nr:transketolase family protein [Candidatus Lokiarchaeota archaeon]